MRFVCDHCARVNFVDAAQVFQLEFCRGIRMSAYFERWALFVPEIGGFRLPLSHQFHDPKIKEGNAHDAQSGEHHHQQDEGGNPTWNFGDL